MKLCRKTQALWVKMVMPFSTNAFLILIFKLSSKAWIYGYINIWKEERRGKLRAPWQGKHTVRPEEVLMCRGQHISCMLVLHILTVRHTLVPPVTLPPGFTSCTGAIVKAGPGAHILLPLLTPTPLHPSSDWSLDPNLLIIAWFARTKDRSFSFSFCQFLPYWWDRSQGFQVGASNPNIIYSESIASRCCGATDVFAKRL